MKRKCLFLFLLDLSLCIYFIYQQDFFLIAKKMDLEVFSIFRDEGSESGVGLKIALTFDDGPDSIYTPQLLDGLAQRNVKASFFVIGKEIEGNEELLERMHQEGHLIGSHTYSHVQLTTLSNEEACEEVDKTNELIYEITGEYPMFIRAPFGEWNESLDSCILMFPVKWTVDTLDWKTQNITDIVSRAVTGSQDNDIILMHDEYEESVEAALQIIDILQAEGYEFVTVDQILLE